MAKEEIKVTLKNSWKEVTLKEFFQLQNIIKTSENDLECNMFLLELLSDLTIEQIYSMSYTDMINLVRKIDFCFKRPVGKLNKNINMGGRKFRFNPDARSMTAIQYLDVSTLLKDNADNKNLHNILAVILEDVDGPKHNTKDYDVYKNGEFILENISVEDALAISSFFLQSFKASTNLILDYLTSMMKKEKNKEKKIEIKRKMLEILSLKSSVGITT